MSAGSDALKHIQEVEGAKPISIQEMLRENKMRKAQKQQNDIDFALEHLYDGGSAFESLTEQGDSDRTAVIHLSSMEPEQTFLMDVEHYKTLLGILRYAEDQMKEQVKRFANTPGAHSSRKDKLTKLKKQYDQIVDMLCTFDE